MKIRMLVPALCALVLVAGPAGAMEPDMKALGDEAKQVMMGFGKQLKQELVGAMKESGPVHALESCNLSAPSITAQASDGGWDVSRTSLKTRNPGNEPDAWELEVLNEFEAKKAKGTDPAKLAFAEVVEEDGKKVYRFMKAIPTAELCLSCHGTGEVKPEVEAKLSDLYPDDKARGFKKGDIRGAFSLRKPL